MLCVRGEGYGRKCGQKAWRGKEDPRERFGGRLSALGGDEREDYLSEDGEPGLPYRLKGSRSGKKPRFHLF